MNFITIIISAICIAFIGFCLYLVFKNIKNQIQGKGCGRCHNCSGMCSKQINNKPNQKNKFSL